MAYVIMLAVLCSAIFRVGGYGKGAACCSRSGWLPVFARNKQFEPVLI
jgi:hypothetical protein